MQTVLRQEAKEQEFHRVNELTTIVSFKLTRPVEHSRDFNW